MTNSNYNKDALEMIQIYIGSLQYDLDSSNALLEALMKIESFCKDNYINWDMLSSHSQDTFIQAKDTIESLHNFFQQTHSTLITQKEKE